MNCGTPITPPPPGCVGTAGWPYYGCGNNTGLRRVYDFNEVPPPMGCPIYGCTSQTVTNCTAGHLQDCGAQYGINIKGSDPFYNDNQFVRVGDKSDADEGCGQGFMGPGGASEYNVFEKDDNYFAMSCGNFQAIKWFDPVNMQVLKSVDNAGWVHCNFVGCPQLTTSNPIFYPRTNAVRFAYTKSNILYVLDHGTITQYTLTAGMVTAGIQIGDMTWAIPCWQTSCPEWAAHTTYQPGSNIVWPPTGTAPPTPCPGTAVSGGVSPCAAQHSLQLINWTSCTSSAAVPNFDIIFTNRPSNNTQQWVVQDNDCQWADMWIPPTKGGRIQWGAGGVGDSTDTIFSQAISNNSTQDAAGGCFGLYYNSNNNLYSHLNTCTGNVYNVTGTGITPTFIGNAFLTASQNPAFTSAQTPPKAFFKGLNMHAFFGSKNGLWVYYGGDLAATGGCGLVFEDGTRALCDIPAGTNPNNTYFWWYGTTNIFDSRSFVGMPGGNDVGHKVPGFNVFVYRPVGNTDSTIYRGVVLSPNLPLCPRPFGNPPSQSIYSDTCRGWFNTCADTGCGTVNVPTDRGCRPNPCLGPYPFNSGSQLIRKLLDFDEHASWVSNNGSDTTPICDSPYPTFPFEPPRYAFNNEIFCFQTDGSNRVAREAFQWNTWSTTAFANYNSIGSLSSDGKFWGWNSDWYCTLGNSSGGATSICGLQFWFGHTYSVGEFMGSPSGSGKPGQIYVVTTAGVASDSTSPPTSAWCNTAGCVIDCNALGCGTVVFTRYGTANQNNSVFIVKLQ
jgi:hypothetical protein